MDLIIKLSVLNTFLKANNTGIKLCGISDDTFELFYDPGALLPNVTLRMRTIGSEPDFVTFKYEVQGVSSFMLSVANGFSFLPQGIEVDETKKTITVFPAKLKFLGHFSIKCCFKYFKIRVDTIEVGMVLV